MNTSPNSPSQQLGSSISEYYQQRGLASRIGFGRMPCLVVVDLMKAYTDARYKLGSDLSGVVEVTAQLLNQFREAGRPVYFITTGYRKDLRDAGVFGRKVPGVAELQLDTEAVEVDPRVSPTASEPVIVKKATSAFLMTHLPALLVEDNIDTVVVAGASTSGCIRATVIDACAYGYRTIVPAEAVGDRSKAPHEANLFDMDAKYADVTTVDDVIAALDG